MTPPSFPASFLPCASQTPGGHPRGVECRRRAAPVWATQASEQEPDIAVLNNWFLNSTSDFLYYLHLQQMVQEITGVVQDS